MTIYLVFIDFEALEKNNPFKHDEIFFNYSLKLFLESQKKC